MPGVFPYTNMRVPMLYTAFEVTGAAITGLRAGLDIQGQEDVNVVGFAGDGGTADIGIQSLSGAVERGHNVFYIMYDNEAYMNTGIQRSGATPKGAWTTTTPVGKQKDWKKEDKKQMIDILVAHKIPYAATATVGYPEDLIKKLQRAKEIKGPKFFHIFAPCPTGWKSSPDLGVELSKLAVETNVFPLYEVVHGVYKFTKKVKEPKPVQEYLLLQGRYSHVKKYPELLAEIQKDVDKRYNELLSKEKYTAELYGTEEKKQ